MTLSLFCSCLYTCTCIVLYMFSVLHRTYNMSQNASVLFLIMSCFMLCHIASYNVMLCHVMSVSADCIESYSWMVIDWLTDWLIVWCCLKCVFTGWKHSATRNEHCNRQFYCRRFHFFQLKFAFVWRINNYVRTNRFLFFIFIFFILILMIQLAYQFIFSCFVWMALVLFLNIRWSLFI
jgi:hypothetical protein